MPDINDAAEKAAKEIGVRALRANDQSAWIDLPLVKSIIAAAIESATADLRAELDRLNEERCKAIDEELATAEQCIEIARQPAPGIETSQGRANYIIDAIARRFGLEARNA